jgi:transcriptional regulator with XRE-family HTH domain
MHMDLIDRLETYRLENKITQEEIAEKLGVAFSTVNRWLNHHVKPNKIQSYHIQKLIGEGASRGKRKK